MAYWVPVENCIVGYFQQNCWHCRLRWLVESDIPIYDGILCFNFKLGFTDHNLMMSIMFFFSEFQVKELKKLVIDHSEMEALKDVLKPLSTATTVLSTAQHATLSLLLPLKESILRHCTTNDDDSSFIRKVKEKIHGNLSPR